MTAPAAPVAPVRLQPVQRRTRPTTQYWDVFTASWQTRGPVVPAPRSRD